MKRRLVLSKVVRVPIIKILLLKNTYKTKSLHTWWYIPTNCRYLSVVIFLIQSQITIFFESSISLLRYLRVFPSFIAFHTFPTSQGLGSYKLFRCLSILCTCPKQISLQSTTLAILTLLWSKRALCSNS